MSKHLILFDFDRTIAETSADSGNGIDVDEASGLAVQDIFGEKGYDFFRTELGGLRNREPSELIELIINGAGIGLEGININTATELFVQSKLRYLLDEITFFWPVLYPGVRDFFNDVRRGRIPVDIGIVSSGHDDFIKKTLKVNGIEPPDILVTSDELRRRYNKFSPPRFKPNPYQIAVAHKKWESWDKRQEGRIAENGWVSSNAGKEGMVYVGDDPEKDGKLADRSRIPFIFVPFSGKDFSPDPDKGQMAVADFHELREVFKINKKKIEEGVSMSEILLGKPYEEIFTQSTEGALYNRMLSEVHGNIMARR